MRISELPCWWAQRSEFGDQGADKFSAEQSARQPQTDGEVKNRAGCQIFAEINAGLQVIALVMLQSAGFRGAWRRKGEWKVKALRVDFMPWNSCCGREEAGQKLCIILPRPDTGLVLQSPEGQGVEIGYELGVVPRSQREIRESVHILAQHSRGNLEQNRHRASWLIWFTCGSRGNWSDFCLGVQQSGESVPGRQVQESVFQKENSVDGGRSQGQFRSYWKNQWCEIGVADYQTGWNKKSTLWVKEGQE